MAAGEVYAPMYADCPLGRISECSLLLTLHHGWYNHSAASCCLLVTNPHAGSLHGCVIVFTLGSHCSMHE